MLNSWTASGRLNRKRTQGGGKSVDEVAVLLPVVNHDRVFEGEHEHGAPALVEHLDVAAEAQMPHGKITPHHVACRIEGRSMDRANVGIFNALFVPQHGTVLMQVKEEPGHGSLLAISSGRYRK